MVEASSAASLSAPDREKPLRQTERFHYIDAIRVLGMFMVVLLHASAEKLRTDIGTPGWHVVNMATSLATVAVPLFFMVSGAVILSSESTEDYLYVLKKRIPKLFVPLLAWSVVALGVSYMIGSFNQAANIGQTILSRAQRFFTSPVQVHFWFMYTLIPLYLFSPLLKGAVRNRRNLRYAVLLFFAISLLGSIKSLLPEAYAFIPDITFIRGAAYGSYIYYFMLGYFLHSAAKYVDSRLLAGAAIVSWLVIGLGTHLISTADNYSELFKSYTGIYSLVLSCSLFLLCKNLVRKPLPAVGLLSSLSFGVYLLHNILIALCMLVFPKFGLYISFAYVSLAFFSVSLLSCALIWLLSRFRVTAYVFCGLQKRK